MGALQNLSNYIFKGFLFLLVAVVLYWFVKKILYFFGFSTKFRWGLLNYWFIKRSRALKFDEMRFLKTLAEEFKIQSPSYLLGKDESLDYYFRFHINSLFKNNMNYWVRIRRLSKILEVRRKFAMVPMSGMKVRHSRQFAPGNKMRIIIKDKGFYDGVIGENRYQFFTVTIPSLRVADMLKKEKRVKCKLNRIGDGQYIFFSKIGFVSTGTEPKFMQLKHTRKLKREQFRKDLRAKTEIVCDIISTKLLKTKKGFIFSDTKTDRRTGFVRDISSGGCSVSLHFTPKPGEFYKIKFKLLGEELEIAGRVLRYKPLTKHSDRGFSHFKFIGMPLKAKVMIQLFAYKLHPNFLNEKKRKF